MCLNEPAELSGWDCARDSDWHQSHFGRHLSHQPYSVQLSRRMQYDCHRVLWGKRIRQILVCTRFGGAFCAWHAYIDLWAPLSTIRTTESGLCASAGRLHLSRDMQLHCPASSQSRTYPTLESPIYEWLRLRNAISDVARDISVALACALVATKQLVLLLSRPPTRCAEAADVYGELINASIADKCCKRRILWPIN